MKVIHMVSTENNCWQAGTIMEEAGKDTLSLTGKKNQSITGFGGCFNEIGWEALKKVSKAEQKTVLDEFFLEENSGFRIGRVPVGANDFSLKWYSCDETEEDYELEHFTIERDKQYTIPFIKEAAKRQPELMMFASPWSPPTWMKTKKVYNYGTLRMEDKVLMSYANYLVKFVTEYKKEGIEIRQLHVQNEPMADQKFPSCLWTGEQMRDFIKYYLGPVVEQTSQETEIWVGTINGPFIDFMMGPGSAPFSEYYDQFENTILWDEEARKYITGLGFQWGGKHSIDQTVLSYPELRYMMTESECGNGENSWEHAEYIFRQMWHYFRHGVESYIYWNLVLPEDGISTWGWRQNSLVTVNETTGKITYQPEFYLMKHFSHYIKKGARVLETKGRWASNSIVFENTDGGLVIIVGSNMNQIRTFCFQDGERSFSAAIEPHSIHTFVI